MTLPNWAHPAPVFLDFETQSACDIKEHGARTYIEHPSTRVLILALAFEREPGNVDSVEFHVWVPDHIKCDTVSRWGASPLMWPHQLKERRTVRVHRGNLHPDSTMGEILDSIKDRPLVAHNAYGFDRGIWDRCVAPLLHEEPGAREWLDSLPVARYAGRGGRLDAIGKQLFGTGKDQAKKLLPKLTTAKPGLFDGGFTYPVMNAGELQAFTRYAVGDVELLRRMWREFEDVNIEPDVIAVNDRINARGIAVDVELLEIVKNLSRYSTATAASRIEKLTGGALHADNIRSGKVVHEWLDRYGVQITDENGKPCLRKDQVQKFIDSPYVIQENLTAAVEIPPVCIDVMRLRMKALRITDAKVERAQHRASADGRLRDLFAIHAAHTGRFSSYGVQIHNLPRPHESVSPQVEWLVNAQTVVPYVPCIDRKGRDIGHIFDRIKEHLPNPAPGGTAVTVDDICSALIRPSLMAGRGHVLVIADYAQVEARGAAWLCDETKMLDAFRAGRDLYREFAARMFHCTPEQVTKTQRQIAKSAVLGCQYGLGANKFRVYAANNGCNLADAGITAEEVIAAYRDEFQKIAGWRPDKGKNFRVGGMWKLLENAVKETVGTGAVTRACKCSFRLRGRDLILTLPSGRELTYPNARIEDVIPPYVYAYGLDPIPKATVVYDSERGPKSLYGGLITENVVQAMCRDIMCDALVRLDRAGYNIVLHVHDEIGSEEREELAREKLRGMVEVMSTPPDWAEGFPLEVEGYTCRRFAKSAFFDSIKLDTRALHA